MDGGSADHAGAVICRPPWMAGVQITQDRLSAAIAADNASPDCVASVWCDFQDPGGHYLENRLPPEMPIGPRGTTTCMDTPSRRTSITTCSPGRPSIVCRVRSDMLKIRLPS